MLQFFRFFSRSLCFSCEKLGSLCLFSCFLVVMVPGARLRTGPKGGFRAERWTSLFVHFPDSNTTVGFFDMSKQFNGQLGYLVAVTLEPFMDL